MGKTMNWSAIVSNAKKIKSNVAKNQKLGTISGYNSAEILYIFSKAVINPGKNVTLNHNYTNCAAPSGTAIYQQLPKKEYLDVAKRIVEFMDDKKHGYKSPNFITFKKDRIKPRLAIFALAKIIVFYADNKRMANTCWFANSVFNTKTTVTGVLCTKLSKLTGVNITNYKTLYTAMKRFSYDYYYNDKQTQAKTLTRLKGNCVDLNQIEYYCLLEIYSKDKVQIVRGVVKCSDGKNYGHVWCRLLRNGSWLNMDASAAAKGKELGSVICPKVVSITDINPSWAAHDTGDM